MSLDRFTRKSLKDKHREQAMNKEEKKEEVNESLALTLALALPLILEAGGSLANLLKRKYGLDKEKSQRYENWKKLYKQSEERLKAAEQEKNEAGVEKEKKQQEEWEKEYEEYIDTCLTLKNIKVRKYDESEREYGVYEIDLD